MPEERTPQQMKLFAKQELIIKRAARDDRFYIKLLEKVMEDPETYGWLADAASREREWYSSLWKTLDIL